MSWDIGEYQLADGATAIITHVQPEAKRRYIGMIRKANGELKGADWDSTGKWGSEAMSFIGWDLPGANLRNEIFGFCNVYKTEGVWDLGPLHDTIEDAKKFGSDDAVAIVNVQVFFKEGENL